MGACWQQARKRATGHAQPRRLRRGAGHRGCGEPALLVGRGRDGWTARADRHTCRDLLRELLVRRSSLSL